MTTSALYLALFVAGTFASDSYSEEEPALCRTAQDCQASSVCHSVECLEAIGCSETRLPVRECCVDDSECAFFATSLEEATCTNNVCVLTPTLDNAQCEADKDCNAFASSVTCANQGKCFFSVCNNGWCECEDLTDVDRDGDGVKCPHDCDDRDSRVQEAINCFVDSDQDGFPNCNKCQQLCVPESTTCPLGFVEQDVNLLPGDRTTSSSEIHGEAIVYVDQGKCVAPLLFDLSSELEALFDFSSSSSSRLRSEALEDDGQPWKRHAGHFASHGFYDVDDDDDDTSSSSSSASPSSTTPDFVCDCCDRDPFAFPGSSYTFIQENKCGDYDYNCDGSEDLMACCSDGISVGMPFPSHNNHVHHRVTWDSDTCFYAGEREEPVCGGCSNAIPDIGWSCQVQCDAEQGDDGQELFRKRQVDNCPELCGGECACVSQSHPPIVGECASVVTSCTSSEPNQYFGETSCCVATLI